MNSYAQASHTAIFWGDSSLRSGLNWDILNDIKGNLLNCADVFLKPSSCCYEGKPEFSLCFVEELTHSCTSQAATLAMTGPPDWVSWLVDLLHEWQTLKRHLCSAAADTRVHQLVMPEAPLEVWRRHEGHVKVSSQIESRKYDGSGGIDNSDGEDEHVRRWQ